MTWLGKWRNQYGSVLEITDESNHRIVGSFRTALADSGFSGQEIPIVGFHQGNCIGLSGGGRAPAGDMVVTYTGLLRQGRLETLWYVVADAALSAASEGEPAKVQKLNWWRAMTTSADTFERVP
jgi:hypothetical protein